MSAEPFGTWTAYPSLLSSLTHEQQVSLERAASAHYCGRYHEADDIFASDLGTLHTIPIVALQHADMLTASGRERERVDIIRAAQASLDPQAEDSASLSLLLELMLAEAEYFANGLLPETSQHAQPWLLRRVRSLFWDGGVEGLSDLQIRAAATYYQFADVLKEDTNLLGESDENVFEKDVADTHFPSRFEEVSAIYRALKTERRWRHAPQLMGFLLQYAPQGSVKRQEAVDEAGRLLETLSAAVHPGIRYRSVVLRNSVISLVTSGMQANNLRARNTQDLIRLTPEGFASWRDFCPIMAAKMDQLEAQRAATRPQEIASLTELARAAEGRADFLAADQLYRAARNTNEAWLDGAGADGASQQAAGASFRHLQEAYIEFHATRTRSDYYYSSGLADLLHTLRFRSPDPDAVIDLVDRFEADYPDVAIPRSLERIYDNASRVAAQRGIIDKLGHYTEQLARWNALCPFSDASGNLSDRAVLDPDHAIWWLTGSGSGDAVNFGNNAVRLMLRWAAYEWDEGLLSADEVRVLFHPALDDMPRENLSAYLRDVNFDYTAAAAQLLGTAERPVSTGQFLGSYARLLQWAQTPDRRPALAPRLMAVETFSKSRIRRFGDYLQRTSRGGVTDENNAISEVERGKALEVAQLRAGVENRFVDSTAARRNAIHTLLVRCYRPRNEAIIAVPEADIEARIEDARSLAAIYEGRRDLLRQYDAIVSHIRLLWQRHLIHGAPPEAVLEPAERAEAVFCRVLDLIRSNEPSDNLAARAKASADFPYHAHRQHALAGSFIAHKRCRGQEQGLERAQAFLEQFLGWALRSKGRGFADVLAMEPDITRSIGGAESTVTLPAPVQAESRDGEDAGPSTEVAEVQARLGRITIAPQASPLRGTTVTAAQLAEMLDALPEGVILVDYIDLIYSPEEAKRVAVLHRRGQSPLIAPILPVRVPGQVIGWVSRNLTQNETPLDGPGGAQRLAFLSGLVDFVEKDEFAVKEGETLVLCPTAILNRVPLHAIPVGGRPLIERNPVVYCQSLSILHWLWKKSTRSATPPPGPSPKATVVNPMPANWPGEAGPGTGPPVLSTPGVHRLASELGASYHGGYPVDRTQALASIRGSSVFHYHGHVHYNPNSALDSTMSLSAAAYASPLSRHARTESISARDLFAVPLAEPALATIVGCGSGVAAVSNTDDVLGLPTALFFAGAGAVVSTLWSIDDPDGEAFETEFYAALERRRARCTDAEQHANGQGVRGSLAGMVDLAAVMREAVLALRRRTEERLQAPYHWAAFTLNGFHFIPHWVIPKRREGGVSSTSLSSSMMMPQPN